MVAPESLTQETHFLICFGSSHEEFRWSARHPWLLSWGQLYWKGPFTEMLSVTPTLYIGRSVIPILFKGKSSRLSPWQPQAACRIRA